MNASDFIICPMLCYSNATDKKCNISLVFYPPGSAEADTGDW